MPGTILVSVLGVEDLPSPSLPTSALSPESSVCGPFSLKLVMGKTEYQTTDKGDFSFPVMSVRENLKLILCDAEGNEISRSDVKTMVVVEKRSWDSFFPLEGGGRVHLNLQFILNAEEHKRIHEMREAVLKRKRAELLKSISNGQITDKAPGFSTRFVGEEESLPDRLILKAPVKDSFPVAGILGNCTDGGKILVAPSQNFQQLPEHQSDLDAREHDPQVDSEQSGQHPEGEAEPASYLPEVDSQQSGQHPEEEAQPPSHRPEVDSEQPEHHPQVDARAPEHCSEVDSQRPEHHPKLDARQAQNHPKLEAINRTLEKKEVSGGLANQIDVDEVSSSKEAIDPQLKRSESPVSEDITATSSSPEMAQEIRKISSFKGKNRGKTPVSGVKKMISTFENISSQEPKLPVGSATKSWMRRVEMVDSFKEPWLEGLSTEQEATVGRTLPKSFSTGSLSGTKSPKLNSVYVQVQEEEKHCDLAVNKKDLGSNQKFPESENDQNYEKLNAGHYSVVIGSCDTKELPECEKKNDVLDVIQTKEVVTFCKPVTAVEGVDTSSLEAKESTPFTFQFRDRGELGEKMGLDSFPKGGSSLDSESSSRTLDATISYYGKERQFFDTRGEFPLINKTEDKMLEGPTIHGQYLSDYLESSDREGIVHTSGIKKVEEDRTVIHVLSRQIVADPANTEEPCSSFLHPSQRDSTLVKLESGFVSPSHTIRESITIENSNTKIDILAYFDAEQCLLGSHGNRIPRHVCITSGTKQLRDAIECYHIHL